jgi:predicted ATP-dependent serine protease
MEDYIKFRCKECGFRVKTSSENVGKKGACPECETINIIPEAVDIAKDLEELGVGNLLNGSDIDLSKF